MTSIAHSYPHALLSAAVDFVDTLRQVAQFLVSNSGWILPLVATILGSLVGLYVERWHNHKDQRRKDAQGLLQQQRNRVRAVVAVEYDKREQDEDLNSYFTRVMVVKNHGALPVYDLYVEYLYVAPIYCVERVDQIVVMRDVKHISVLQPNEEQSLDLGEFPAPNSFLPESGRKMPLWLTDADGNLWYISRDSSKVPELLHVPERRLFYSQLSDLPMASSEGLSDETLSGFRTQLKQFLDQVPWEEWADYRQFLEMHYMHSHGLHRKPRPTIPLSELIEIAQKYLDSETLSPGASVEVASSEDLPEDMLDLVTQTAIERQDIRVLTSIALNQRATKYSIEQIVKETDYYTDPELSRGLAINEHTPARVLSIIASKYISHDVDGRVYFLDHSVCLALSSNTKTPLSDLEKLLQASASAIAGLDISANIAANSEATPEMLERIACIHLRSGVEEPEFADTINTVISHRNFLPDQKMLLQKALDKCEEGCDESERLRLAKRSSNPYLLSWLAGIDEGLWFTVTLNPHYPFNAIE